MNKPRKWVLASITVMVSFALCLGLAEVVLRFLPVATGIRSSAESSANSVFRFVPNRDFVFSKRWDMIMANRGHVNNAGFVKQTGLSQGGPDAADRGHRRFFHRGGDGAVPRDVTRARRGQAGRR